MYIVISTLVNDDDISTVCLSGSILTLCLSMLCSGVDRASGQMEEPGWRKCHRKCFKIS